MNHNTYLELLPSDIWNSNISPVVRLIFEPLAHKK